MGNSKRAMNRGSDTDTDERTFQRNITTLYGLNLALSYENAAVDRLKQRLSECAVPEVKKNLERHLKQTYEQQNRLRKRIEVLANTNTISPGDNDDSSSLSAPDLAAMKPTDEKGRLPVPEPPKSLKAVMNAVGTDSERDVWESVNDLIIERAEVIMYRAGIDALRLLEADKKTIDALRMNLKEEEAFAKWLERNNPAIAKKLMKKQMREGKRKKRMADITATAESEGKNGDVTVTDTQAATTTV